MTQVIAEMQGIVRRCRPVGEATPESGGQVLREHIDDQLLLPDGALEALLLVPERLEHRLLRGDDARKLRSERHRARAGAPRPEDVFSSVTGVCSGVNVTFTCF